MKNIKLIVFGLLVIVGLSACSEKWLDNDLEGSVLSQEDFDKLNNTIDGSVRGMYALLYTRISDGHDDFGQKTIDLSTDFMSGDISMGADAYGWFVTDAQLLGSGTAGSRNAYIWTYYYRIIMNVNMTIRNIRTKQIKQQGKLTLEDKHNYAQALTMRAYFYYNLLTLYTPGRGDQTPGYYGGSGMDYRAVPYYSDVDSMYTKDGLPKEQNLSRKYQLFEYVHQDLAQAIDYFDTIAMYPDSIPARTNKLYFNSDLARAFNAYTFLFEEKYDTAYKVAMEVINYGVENYQIIPYADVLNTGFVDVNNPSWMWGHDITIETTGGLASFWGHMDVHTYSYAQAGATKVIDQNLYSTIYDYDIRKKWFHESELYPDYKFYDLKRGTGIEVDRRWLNDVVFMRIEEMYLIAAEAAYRNGQMDDAKRMLTSLVSERYRLDPEQEGQPGSVEELISAMDPQTLEAELEYNWRIEMWGEGRSLLTFKRFGKVHQTANSNRAFLKGEKLEPTDERMTFRLPSGELSSNSHITLQ